MWKSFIGIFLTRNVTKEWNMHQATHLHYRNDVYTKFHVSNIKEVLNLEPSIDHEDVYNAIIPDYFKEGTTLQWIDQHFDQLPQPIQYDAINIVCEEAAIQAAHAMCHPRDRVGKFDWSDVLRLHVCLNTPYLAFIKKHNLFFQEFKE